MQMQINMQSACVTLSKIPSFFWGGGARQTLIAMKIIYILVLSFIHDNARYKLYKVYTFMPSLFCHCH